MASTSSGGPSASAADPLDLLFYALSDPTRRRLLTALAGRPARVTDLARPFRMSLPAVSKHLKVLERAGLVSRSVRGRVHSITLAGEPMRQVELWLDPFRVYWDVRLRALDLEVQARRARRQRLRSRKPRPVAGPSRSYARRRRSRRSARPRPGRARRPEPTPRGPARPVRRTPRRTA